MQLKTIMMTCIAGMSHFANAQPQSISQQIKLLAHNDEKEIEISVSKSLKIKALISKTSKGNGTLLLGDYSLLRIYDAHSDGYTYGNGFALTVDLKDITGNGMNELIISGVATHTDEKEAVLGHEQIIYIYHYQNGKCNVLYKKTPIEIDLAK